MLVTLSGMLMAVSLLQYENAAFPMLVTLFGIVQAVKLELLNAESLILVTLFGIVTVVRLWQKENALLPIICIPCGIAYSVISKAHG